MRRLIWEIGRFFTLAPVVVAWVVVPTLRVFGFLGPLPVVWTPGVAGGWGAILWLPALYSALLALLFYTPITSIGSWNDNKHKGAIGWKYRKFPEFIGFRTYMENRRNAKLEKFMETQKRRQELEAILKTHNLDYNP